MRLVRKKVTSVVCARTQLKFLQVLNEEVRCCSIDPSNRAGRHDHCTVIRSWILENSPSLMPLTVLMSSIVLKGRPSMMA